MPDIDMSCKSCCAPCVPSVTCCPGVCMPQTVYATGGGVGSGIGTFPMLDSGATLLDYRSLSVGCGGRIGSQFVCRQVSIDPDVYEWDFGLAGDDIFVGFTVTSVDLVSCDPLYVVFSGNFFGACGDGPGTIEVTEIPP